MKKVLVLVLLVFSILGVADSLVGIDRVQIARAQEGDCGLAGGNQLRVGYSGRVTVEDGIGSYLQTAPSERPDLYLMPEGHVFDVIGGPVCKNGFRWWQLRISDGTIGWTADGDKQYDWLEPISDHSKITYQIGSTVEVIDSDLNCRDGADTAGSIIRKLNNHESGRMIDGPVINQGYQWIKLDLGGDQCWVATGDESYVWLFPVNSSGQSATTNNWPSTQNQTADYQRYRLNDDEELQLKSQDDGKGRTLATIKGGDIVTVLELIDSNGMVIAKVRYGNLVGWVLFQIEGESLFRPVD